MSFLAMDAPRHVQMRSLVSKGFTPRRVRELEGRVREITCEHLDVALAGDTFDFVDDLAGKVPMDVVSELLGVPASDRAELRRLADLVVHREDGVLDVPAAAIDASLQLVVYYVDLVTERRRQRRDDLVSVLIDVEVHGTCLPEDDLVAFLYLMVAAGNETTTKLLANAWYWGYQHRDQGARVLADPCLTARWVDETLRYDASSQVLARTALVDVPLHGEVVPAGDRVLLLIGSANRDARVFTDPDAFDLDRDTSELLSFGNGPHFCLGASLARLEATVVLEELLGTVRDYDLDLDRAERVHSVNVRGFAHLPTTVVRR
jgi:cytochrome P450